MSKRHGDWQTTASGITFWPLDPRAEEIRIGDISHHLSSICRWGGATRGFYSVAEHSVVLSSFFLKRDQVDLARWALLHDAAEAYLGDVVRPLKPFVPEYRQFEAALERMIWAKYGLHGDLPDEVKRADTAILGDERDLLFGNAVHARQKRPGETGLGITAFSQWFPADASWAFLGRFRVLFPGIRDV